MRKKIAVLMFLLAFAAALGVWYYAFQYSKTHHRDVVNETAIVITAAQIVKEFQANEAKANKTYLNKVIQIKGEVVKSGKDQSGNITITLKSDDPFSSVFCTLKTGSNPIHAHQVITVKGICAGFLTDVVLNEVIIVK